MTWLRDFFLGVELIPKFIIPAIGINTIIEILLMTYIIYIILKWVQRTTAWALVKGLAVVLAVFLLAYTLQLDTLMWLLTNAFSVGIIAIMVIFQPELRAALDKLGRNQFLQSVVSSREQHAPQTLSEASARAIIKAVGKMANERTGAFIVIERTVSLLNFDDTGTKIDAAITDGLLVNIFVDKTPLHDGAVIIRDDRVAAASCIMPLTKQEIGAEFGTRHRAAVGTSEASDAYVIVVSEETGRISFCHAGEMKKMQKPEDLAALLIDENKTGKKRGRRRRWKKAND